MRFRTSAGLGAVATLLLVTLVAVLAPGSAAAGTTSVQAPQFDFAPAGQAAIHPGVVTNTKGGECTSNFIFTNGDDLFLGQAAHCASTGGQTATNGCNTGSRPLGTTVKIAGTGVRGTLAYSSWIAMQRVGETNANVCRFNDFALVRIPEDAEDEVNPTVPIFGGPEGLDTDGVPVGETVYSYGNSPLLLGLLHAKVGKNIANTGGGWEHLVLTIPPGVPGDSGSGFLDSDGDAFGVLSTLALAPVPGSNGVGDLAMELRYATAHSAQVDGAIRLVEGTEPFHAPTLPLPLPIGALGGLL